MNSKKHLFSMLILASILILASVLMPFRLAKAEITVTPVDDSYTTNEGTPFTITVNFEDMDASEGDIFTATIDWDDGAIDDQSDDNVTLELTEPFNGTGIVQGSHTYVDEGTYFVPVTINNIDAPDTGAKSLIVIVENAPPIVTPGADQEADEGEEVSISATFTDVGVGDTHTATIDWGDGNTTDGVVDEADGSGAVTATHIYADNGDYNVTITVTDDGDAPLSGECSLTVTVENVAPVVVEPGEPQTYEGAEVTISVEFTDAGTGDTHTAMIDWGDESDDTIDPATSPISANHTYEDDGEYIVTITVTDDDGGSDECTLTVIVLNAPPVVTPGADQEAYEGAEVTISATFTDDAGDTHTATIDWGDGSEDAIDPATSPITASHIYEDDGEYTVTITVTDDDGSSGQGSLTITVNVVHEIPEVEIGPDQTADEGDTVDISATFTDVGDTHTAAIDWGDGSEDTIDPATSPITANHTYEDDREYTVTITVTDDDGDSGQDSLLLTIANVAPVVEPGEPQTGDEGAVVSIGVEFADAGIGDTHTVQIEWEDGTTDDQDDDNVTLTEPDGDNPGTVEATHIYANNGDYNVTITIEDDDGGSHSSTLSVIINNVAPVVEPGDNQEANEGDTVEISATFTDDAGDTHTATIDWGDGNTTDGVVDEADGSGNVTGTHIYADDGNYNVIVTVTDDDDPPLEGNCILSVTIANVAPIVIPGDNQKVDDGEEVTISATFIDAGTGDTHTVQIDWEDGIIEDQDSDNVTLTEPDGGNPGTVTATHTYTDTYTIYLVTIIVTDNDGDSGEIARVSVTINVVTTYSIRLIEPNGGEILQIGSSYDIKWASTGEDIDHVKITYSTDGGQSYPDDNIIVENAPNGDGRYKWAIPAGIEESTQVRLKVIAKNSAGNQLAQDESDNNFTILSNAIVTLKIGDITGLPYPGETICVPIELQIHNHQLIYNIAIILRRDDPLGLLTSPEVNKTDLTADWMVVQNPLGGEVKISMASSNPLTGDGTIVEVLWTVEPTAKGGDSATLFISQVQLNDGAISAGAANPGDFSREFQVAFLELDKEVNEMRVGDSQVFTPINGKPPYQWQVDASLGTFVDNTFIAQGGWMALNTECSKLAEITLTDSTGREATTQVTVKLRCGDADGSGQVDSNDATEVLQHSVEIIQLTGCQPKAADVNGNLDITPQDATLILKYVVGKITEFPVDCPAPPQPLAKVGEMWLGAYQGESESTFTVPVLIKGLDELLSGTLVLSYNPQEIAFVEVESTPLSKDYLFAYNEASGQLTLAFAGETQLNQDGLFLHLNFKKISSNSLRGIDSIVLFKAILNDGNLRVVTRKKPSSSQLLQNYPNPYNPETWIPYQLAEAGKVKIKIYSSTGQLVRHFSLGYKEEGYYLTKDKALHWDGTNHLGERVSSGVYFYSIETLQFRDVKKMLLLK